MPNFSLWILFSVSAPFLWALGNVFDRALMSRFVKNEYALTFAGALMRFPVFLALWFFSDLYVPQFIPFIISVATGFFTITPVLFYLRALEKSEAKSVMLLYDATNPLFVLILSTLFIGERFNAHEGFAFILLLSAGIFSSIRFDRTLRFEKSIFWVVLASFLWAVSDILYKQLMPYFPSATALFGYVLLGGFLSGFLFFIFPKIRNSCRLNNFRWPFTAWILFFIANITAFAGFIFMIKAFELERVALTVVLMAIQPLFVFLFEIFFARFFTIFEKTDTSFANLLPKVIAFVIMIAGVWLLNLSF